MKAKLNKRERRAAALLAHYARCEKLALACGMPAARVDGKKISVALLKIERETHKAMEHACSYPEPFRAADGSLWDFGASEEAMDEFCKRARTQIARALGNVPDGFFVNRDPRGYALKLQPESQAGAEAGLQRDWGGYYLLSPEIEG